MKTTTCKKCGAQNLEWRMSVKGNWYLADPKLVSTNTYGNHITIPFAHNCEAVVARNAKYEVQEKSELRNLLVLVFIGSELSAEQIELLPVLTEKYPEEVIATQEWIANRQKQVTK